MKTERQRIAIAEWCGWKREDIDRRLDYELAELQMQMAEISTDEFYKRHLRVDPIPKPIPDYLNDLNAMHEAEKLLDAHDADTNTPITQANWVLVYGNWLVKLTGLSNPYHATAAQRAEALLRTIGKW